jgi:hypothetical protein
MDRGAAVPHEGVGYDCSLTGNMRYFFIGQERWNTDGEYAVFFKARKGGYVT